MNFETLDAVAVTEHTLVGVLSNKYPLLHGNCFSIVTTTNERFRIVNFVLENLEEALRTKRIDWPIKIHALSKSVAIVHDERIPDNWYQMRFCEVCCPKELLPLPQVLAHNRQIARGERKEDSFCVTMKHPGLRWG